MVKKFFSPFKKMAYGLSFYIRGLKWLRTHPGYLCLLFLPMILSFSLLVVLGGLFVKYNDNIIAMIMYTKPEDFLLLALYHVVKTILYVVLGVMSLVFFMLCFNILASPIYDIVSTAVERDLMGQDIKGAGFWESVLLIKEEIKKVLFIFIVSTIFLMIPGLNLISPFVTAFFLGWEFCDFPLARKNWPFRKRLRFVLGDIWSITGFGFWLLIPGGQMVFMPLAVVGGTLLVIENRTEAKEK
ncbi:MAG: EI24 domain-containing protein [Oligoflexales bacterium]|nr:EI24 domain-containing protein [Oligoflexales bacterium]